MNVEPAREATPPCTSTTMLRRQCAPWRYLFRSTRASSRSDNSPAAKFDHQWWRGTSVASPPRQRAGAPPDADQFVFANQARRALLAVARLGHLQAVVEGRHPEFDLVALPGHLFGKGRRQFGHQGLHEARQILRGIGD